MSNPVVRATLTLHMNFLAHLLLARPTPASRIGNILPDLCRVRGNRGLECLEREVAEGVLTHRRVDGFADTHPLFSRSKSRLFGGCGRYTGIVVDIFYDHVLSLGWERYGDVPLPRFIAEVHRDFATHAHLMPEPMRPVVEHMSEQDWLSSYGSRDGLRLCLRRMSRGFTERFGREVVLESAVDLLDEHGEGLAEDFHAFFPELVRYARPPIAMAAIAPS